MKFWHTKPGKGYYLRLPISKLRHPVRQQWSQKTLLSLTWLPELCFLYDEVYWEYLFYSLGFSKIYLTRPRVLSPTSFFLLSYHSCLSQARDMQEQRSWEHSWMNQKCLCVTGSWPSAAPAISIPCQFWIIHFQMPQSPPGLKLGLVLELVMLAFEINSEMPTDFSTKGTPQPIAKITFIRTPPFLAEVIGNSVMNCSGSQAFVTNYLWGLLLE